MKSAIITAFMFAGGPDIPDAVYQWKASYIVIPGYEVAGTYRITFESRNSCEVNLETIKRLHGASYVACLPVLR